MVVLNSETLLGVMEMCGNISDVHACILFENQWSFDEFEQTFRDKIQYGELKGWKISSRAFHHTSAEIELPNGSSIYLLNSRDLSRVKIELRFGRFHRILYEKGINEFLLGSIADLELMPSPNETCENNGELDDFLKSFKIIPCSVKPL
jgi:hypothetical protein